MSRKVKPFHESILSQLKTAEEKFSKNKNIGMFISRFVGEVEIITSTIQLTDVPKEHLAGLISSLQKFYADFEAKYPRTEDACGAKRERKQIDVCFSEVIANLNQRLAA